MLFTASTSVEAYTNTGMLSAPVDKACHGSLHTSSSRDNALPQLPLTITNITKSPARSRKGLFLFTGLLSVACLM